MTLTRRGRALTLCLRVLLTFCVSVAAMCLLLLASHVGEQRRCHELRGTDAYSIYCAASR